MEEPPLPPMAEAVGVADVAMTGEPQPMAEAVPVDEAGAAAPSADAPPRAEAFADAPAAAVLPFTQFPGLTDTSDPVMKACHAAWNELVSM
eukprot:5535701-Alexandrium_andersonii.AAC.1